MCEYTNASGISAVLEKNFMIKTWVWSAFPLVPYKIYHNWSSNRELFDNEPQFKDLPAPLADGVSAYIIMGKISSNFGWVLWSVAGSSVEKIIARSFCAHWTKLCRVWPLGPIYTTTHGSSVCEYYSSNYSNISVDTGCKELELPSFLFHVLLSH